MLKIVDLSRTFNVTWAEWQRFLPTLGTANYVVEELTLSHNYIEDESMTIFGNALARELSAVTPRVMNCSMQLQICSLLIPKWRFFASVEVKDLGKKAISNSRCNPNSILDLYNSNHTLETLVEDNDSTDLSEKPRSLLRMNMCTNKSEVARRKILRYYLLAVGYPKLRNLRIWIWMYCHLL